MKNDSDVVGKQVEMHSRALGREADPSRVSSVQTKDGPPYSSDETAPAQPLQGPLSSGGVTSPLTFTPNNFGSGLTSAPRSDQGQRCGVDDIVKGS